MITGNLRFGMSWEAFRISILVPAMSKQLIADQGIDGGEPLHAYVNRGRWIVKCACGGAEYAFEGGLFMCRSCWNGGHAHKYRHIIWPENRSKIEGLLLRRPLDCRNWYSGEPLSQLAVENSLHAAELLGGVC